MVKTSLLKIGLSEKEANLYLIIAKHKEITAGEVSKLGEESRTHTYDTINKLLEKGLITYVVKNNVKFFKAVDPKKLLDYLKEKETKIKEEKKEILEIIPKIKDLQKNFKKEDVSIDVYEGGEGIKTIMNDVLREGKDFLTWGATTKVKDYVPDFFIDKYLNERKRKKIKARQLFTDFYGVLKSPLSQNKKLPQEFASPTTTLVYGNKVAVFLWLKIPKVILVNNKDLAKSYRKHFNLMWKLIKK
ncbi:TrmB family transcriptional regulator [Nanoarchaeota archaeon]